MKPFYWCTRFFVLCYFRLFYRHKVYGKEHSLPGRAILAANHSSYLDPPLIGVSWPEEIFYLARKSLFKTKFFGMIIRNLNAYPITGTAQDLASIKQICSILDKNNKVVIFPEGIRSTDGSLGSVKSGIGMLAMKCHSPIIPIYIHGSYDVWNRNQRFPKPWGKTACVIGSPIEWQQFMYLDKKVSQEALANAVRNSITALQKWYEDGATGSPP